MWHVLLQKLLHFYLTLKDPAEMSAFPLTVALVLQKCTHTLREPQLSCVSRHDLGSKSKYINVFCD